MELSNKFLAVLVVLAIAMSGFSTILLLNKLSGITVSPEKITGRAQEDYGKINLTVESTISIRLLESTLIDFGSGYVNTSDLLCNWGGGSTHANLSVTDDGGYVDDNNCWVSQTIEPPEPDQPFYIENDGNQDVQLDINCPSAGTMFSGYAGHNRKNLTWFGSENETNSCSGVLTTTGVCDGTDQTICSVFEYHQPAEEGNGDEIEVGIGVIIPDGLSVQEYNSTIMFTAS